MGNGKQAVLPGMKQEWIAKLQRLGDGWKKIMLDRVDLSAIEKKKKKAIEKYMLEEEIDEYQLDETRTFVIKNGEKHLEVVKSKRKKKDAEE